jgi:hypothetical protein
MFLPFTSDVIESGGLNPNTEEATICAEMKHRAKAYQRRVNMTDKVVATKSPR